ncbi:putative heavy metal-associated domain superfamily [Helianthus annuus]|nr:putative heavy metal-associated domain superfamily [Helianthus annuus]
MEKVSNRSLLYVAHLAVPSSQVIVINANLGCACCRERFHKIMTRIKGLKEYTVDVRNSKVILRGNMKDNDILKNKTVKNRWRRHFLMGWITKSFPRFWF